MWKDLNLSDKAKMMRLAVRSGITDLRAIEDVYNKFAEGGDKNRVEYFPINTPYWTPPAREEVKEVPYRGPKVSDEQLVDEYIDKVLWKMENPREKGYNKDDSKYYSYTDVDASGNTHVNIGPGLEQNGHHGIDYNKGYTREQINDFARNTVQNRARSMSNSLRKMDNEKYAETRDTLSLGPLLSLLDIAYNVKTSNKKNLPEKWPTLVKYLAEGNLDEAETQTYSGSKRRQRMRNDLLTYDTITDETVINR